MELKKILILIGIFIFYIVLINMFASIDVIPNSSQENEQNIKDDGTIIDIGMGEDVSITVTRHRFYGTIIESENSSYLYLLNRIRLPLIVNGINYILFHILFVILYIIILGRLLKRKERVVNG